MRKSYFEKLKEAKKRNDTKLVIDGIDGLYQHLLGGPMLPTQRKLIYGEGLARAYPGPAGCAKTSTLAAFGWGRALLVPGSQVFISRANYNDLLGTTMGAIIAMLDKLPKDVLLDRDKTPPMKWWIKPIYVDGMPDDSQVSCFTFTGLQDDLGSLLATVWLCDEAHEIEEERARECTSRLRAPGAPREDYCAVYVFNPPPKTHWLYTACTGFDHQGNKVANPWMNVYKPEPNENIKNLREGYYDDLKTTLSPQQQKRLIDGEWGSNFQGKPVFPQFKLEVHANKKLEYNPDRPLVRMWDFGFNKPACHFAQTDTFGRLKVLRTILGSMELIDTFGPKVKVETALHFPGAKDITDFGDPAVKQVKDTGSALSRLHAMGISILYRSSTIDEGVKLIGILLNQMIGGEPLLQFDSQNCAPLVEAFQGGYKLDKLGEKPVKDGFYDHPMDAFRYGIINMYASFLAQLTAKRFQDEQGDDSGSLAYNPHDQ